MLDFLVGLVLSILLSAVAVVAVLAGRRYLWLLVGTSAFLLVGYVATALLAYERPRQLITQGEWLAVGLAVGAGALAAVLGRTYPRGAIGAAGFATGAVVLGWFDTIVLYAGGQGVQAAAPLWLILLLILIGGAVGAYLTLRSPETAVVLISTLLGVYLLVEALGLNRNSVWVVILELALALTGVVVQYAAYLREQKALDAPRYAPRPITELDAE